jgi:hypothetical protein
MQDLGIQRLSGRDRALQGRQRPEIDALGDHPVLGRRHAQHVDLLALDDLQPLVRVEAARRAGARRRRAATAR